MIPMVLFNLSICVARSGVGSAEDGKGKSKGKDAERGAGSSGDVDYFAHLRDFYP